MKLGKKSRENIFGKDANLPDVNKIDREWTKEDNGRKFLICVTCDEGEKLESEGE